MFDEPALLMERTIHNLEVLADLLAEEVAERQTSSFTASPQVVACMEARRAIETMVPKLKAASDTWRVQIGMPPRLGCINCDD